MSSTFGNVLHVSIFGQSHSPAIGCSLDGVPAGIAVDLEQLQAFLDRRAPGRDETATKRRETDAAHIIAGIVDGHTTGAPIAAIIENTNTRYKDYSELLRLTKQLIASFSDQTIPNVMHIEFYKNETGDFVFGEMAARRGGGLIKQELAAAYGIDQSKANFLLELGLVDADANITRSSQYGILLETAGLNWPKEKEIPDWAVLESVGKKKGIAHNSVDSDRKFLISGNNESEIIQRSNYLINNQYNE